MAEKYTFGIYEKALQADSWEKMFSDAANSGYTYFELSIDETDRRIERLDWDLGKRLEVLQTAKNQNIEIFSANLSGQRRFPMGSADKVVEEKSMIMLEKGINLCVDMGIRVLLLSGFDVYYETSTTETKKRYVENLFRGSKLAERSGVMLGIEPVEGNIMSVKQAVEIVNQVQSPWLQVYPDVANLAAMGFNPVEELAAGSGHSIGLHIRDAKEGTSYNIPIGTGIVDFKGVFEQLKKNAYGGPIIIELWNEDNPDYLSIIQNEREYLEKILRVAE